VETSSIYLTCPGCAAATLLDRRGPAVRCAACGFDYTAFRKESAPAYERFLVERMREGPGGQLGAAALHQWTGTAGVAESAASLRALAAQHGVALPPPMTTDPILRGALVAVALIVVLVLGSVSYFIAQGSP
jgi:DNA-binding transcriptional LysR family regulator